MGIWTSKPGLTVMTTAIMVMPTAGSTPCRGGSSHAWQPALWWWDLSWALDCGGSRRAEAHRAHRARPHPWRDPRLRWGLSRVRAGAPGGRSRRCRTLEYYRLQRFRWPGIHQRHGDAHQHGDRGGTDAPFVNSDTRFMKGVFRGTDRRMHHGPSPSCEWMCLSPVRARRSTT